MSARKIFENELNELNGELVAMCRLTEDMIESAIDALLRRDRALGRSIKVFAIEQKAAGRQSVQVLPDGVRGDPAGRCEAYIPLEHG